MRIKSHFYSRKTNDHMPIKSAIMKYGWSNFTCQILEEAPIDLLIERETYYIILYNATNINVGYNILIHGFDRTGTTLSEEAKQKISLSMKKNAKRGDNHYYRIHGISEEMRRKMSISNTGKVYPSLRKKLKQIDKNTGLVIKIWDCMGDANVSFGKPRKYRGIHKVIRKYLNGIGYIQKTAHGFKWEYA